MVEIISRLSFQDMYRRGFLAPHLFAQDFLDIELHTGQIAWLNKAGYKNPERPEDGLEVKKPTAKESALSAANRFGKTYVASIKALHRSFYQIRPEKFKFDAQGNLKTYKFVSIAMSLDQAMLTYNYALNFAKNAPRFNRFVIDEETVGTPFPKLTIGINTGPRDRQFKSQIWARSTAKRAKFLLGHSFNFISWDEAAFDPALLQEEVLDKVIRARTFDEGGDIDFISSPNGYNKFKEIWDLGQGNDPFYYSFAGSLFMNFNPRTGKEYISFEDVKRDMQKMNADDVTQNIYGLFAKFNSLFPPHLIAECYRDQDYRFGMGGETLPGMYLPPNYILTEKTVDNESGQDAVTLQPKKSDGQRYVVGVDLARKKDFTCIIVLQLPENPDLQPLRLVYFELMNKAKGHKWADIWNRIQGVAKAYNNAPVMIDSTAMGGDMAMETLADTYGLSVDGRNFNSQKENLIIQTQEAIQSKKIVFPYIPTLVRQLTHYDWKDRYLETDAVMALALAIEAAKVAMNISDFVAVETPDIPIYVKGRELGGKLILPDYMSDDTPDFPVRIPYALLN